VAVAKLSTPAAVQLTLNSEVPKQAVSMRTSDPALNSTRNAKLTGFVLRATLLSCRALLVDVRTGSRWAILCAARLFGARCVTICCRLRRMHAACLTLCVQSSACGEQCM